MESLLPSAPPTTVNTCGFAVAEVDSFFTSGLWDSDTVLGEDEDAGSLGVRFLALRASNTV